jgi:hypothetical protein
VVEETHGVNEGRDGGEEGREKDRRGVRASESFIKSPSFRLTRLAGTQGLGEDG